MTYIAVVVLVGVAIALAAVVFHLFKSLEEARSRVLSTEREALKSEFAEIAARILGDKERNLASANERSVDSLFRQLQEKLSKYETEVEKAASENSKLGEHMKTQLAALQNFADKAQAFTAALIGGNKIQGNKGEDILAQILEQSGFRKGREYDTQTGAAGEGRPDASIYDALNSRIILIDAKMNIKDYIAAYNLPGDDAHKAEKERLFKAHAASIKRQIDSLASKNYAETVAPSREGYSNLPLVAMFCPFEAVLETALAYDPTLMHHAYERKIVLVTPLTLWGYLLLVSWGWKQRAVEKKFDEIQATGQEVVSALDSLLNDIENAGDMLAKANASFESLRRRATEEKGQMSVRRVARKLIEFGVVPAGKLKQLGKPSPGDKIHCGNAPAKSEGV